MSNVDRLRRAADQFGEMYAVAYHDGIEPVKDLSDEIAALLLRAVADEVRLNPCHSEPVAATAFALADTILGVES